jgi:hypothetical protein
VNGAGSYGWGGADGTQFVVDRSKGTATLFMMQTQHYKAPTYPAFLALANEACGLTAPGAMTSTPGGTGSMSSPFKQRAQTKTANSAATNSPPRSSTSWMRTRMAS